MEEGRTLCALENGSDTCIHGRLTRRAFTRTDPLNEAQLILNEC